MTGYNWNEEFENSFSPQRPDMPRPTPRDSEQENKRAIRRLGFYNGCGLVAYIVIQSLIYVLLTVLGLMESYDTDPVYQSAVNIVLTVLGMLLPYILFGRLMIKRSEVYPGYRKKGSPLGLNKPKGGVNFFLAVFAGLGFCMVANIITGIFGNMMSLFGYELTSPELSLPMSPEGILLTVLQVSILAGFGEELCLRGYTMGSLRPFGDRDAIIISSAVFALMHGNLVQSPFALIAGLAIGYLSVKTGSIWTGIAIHCLNNLLSVLVSYSSEIMDEGTVNLVYTAVIYALILGGAVCFFVLRHRTGHIALSPGESKLGTVRKLLLFFFNPPMLIAVGYMLYITAQYIEKVV